MKEIPRLIPTMRWFGAKDPVPLSYLAQAGCEGVVTALHQVPVGQIWQLASIQAHQDIITQAGLVWSVVESLPVHEDIKTWSGNVDLWLENYRQSLRHLASCGIHVVTYNFMPVLDWLRTDLVFRLPNGAEALRFVPEDFAVADLFLLKRPGAEAEYSEKTIEQARLRFESMDESLRAKLLHTVLLGLPGSSEAFTREEVLTQLAKYAYIDHDQLQKHLIRFWKPWYRLPRSWGFS